jgi:hypothetical protein
MRQAGGVPVYPDNELNHRPQLAACREFRTVQRPNRNHEGMK